MTWKLSLAEILDKSKITCPNAACARSPPLCQNGGKANSDPKKCDVCECKDGFTGNRCQCEFLFNLQSHDLNENLNTFIYLINFI